jgi:hypothetical protein
MYFGKTLKAGVRLLNAQFYHTKLNYKPMRKVSKEIAQAFMRGERKSIGNTKTDGRIMLLYGNRIAEWREDGVYITNCGWRTMTTKDRLNALPEVNIYQSGGNWYLNGSDEPWDGNWVKVIHDTPPAHDPAKSRNMFDLSETWVSSDGWRGYREPKYAVCGANDTGMWEDSPCRSDVAMSELESAVKVLEMNKIPTKVTTCETSNVFCVHHYVVVPPYYIDNAREVVRQHINNIQTNLMYMVAN